jgi:uncharacterized protein YjcR
MPVADICRKAGISPATDFNWKKRYDFRVYRQANNLEVDQHHGQR